VPELASTPISRVEPSSARLAEERTVPPGTPAASAAAAECVVSGHESLSDAQTALGLGRPAEPGRASPAAGLNPELWGFLAPAEQPDEIGRLGPYRVLQVLGAGGMGVVFRAEDPGLRRLVALKAMLPALAGSASAKERFFREARSAAALKHPHIVTIFQVGEDGGVPFLAMEFLEGESLDQRLQRDGSLPIAEVLRIGRE